jgi:hypothetical protein
MSDASPAPSDPPRPLGRTQERRYSLGVVIAALVLLAVVVVLALRIHHLDGVVASTQKELADSKDQATKAQTELDQIKATTGKSEAQLDAAKAQVTELQAQLERTKATGAQTQAQLDASKAQATDLQSQLDKSRAQSTDFEAQVKQASAGSYQLLSQINQDKIQANDLQARLQKAESDIAQLQPMLLKARHLPVTTSFDRSHGGDTFILHIKNLYLEPVSVKITVAGNGKSRSQSNILGPGASLDVGRIVAGEAVTIASESYDPLTVSPQ